MTLENKQKKLFQFLRETIAYHLTKGVYIDTFRLKTEFYSLVVKSKAPIFVRVIESPENGYSGKMEIGPDVFVTFDSKLDNLGDFLDV
tara:strand:- start:140 stop:403 length:264 start_codon:yes stop_codon:yes gene_type:complete